MPERTLHPRPERAPEQAPQTVPGDSFDDDPDAGKRATGLGPVYKA